eukprot:gene54443-72754_t
MVNNSEGLALFADEATAAQVDAVRGQLKNVAAERSFLVGAPTTGWMSADRLVADASDEEVEHGLVPTDSMSIIYSSGSTGVPKGIEHSHFARLAYPLATGPSMGIDRYSVSIATTPLYTNGTWITMLPTVYSGGTTVLLKKFSPVNFLEAVQRHGGTHVFMVPTQYILICAEPELRRFDTSSMRVLLSGGQALPSTVFDDLLTKFPTAGIHEIYGITEAGLKKTGKDARVLPRTVIYDPELTLSLPVQMSVTSGINAIAHAAEGLYSVEGNPVIDLMAEEGIA